jgi:lactate permease
LLPCVVVVVSILCLRWGSDRAAIAAAITAALIWAAGAYLPPEFAQFGRALVDALILEMLVAAIILPGLLFVEISERIGAPMAVGNVIQQLQLDPPKSAIVIAAGVGIMLESLTGFGVSLLVTVPLLVSQFERRHAIGLALIGMSLTPWGALSLAAHLGAELAALPLERFAAMAWRTSGPVAFALPLLCLLFVTKPTIKDVVFAVFAGLILSGGIGFGTWAVGVEIAGVVGGLAVIGLAVVISTWRLGFGLFRVFLHPALGPYYGLIVAVLAQKLLLSPLADSGIAPVVTSGRVTFSVLASPGAALSVAIVMSLIAFRRKLLATRRTRPLLMVLWTRGRRPLASILMFMLAARLLVEVGAIQAVADMLSGFGAYPALVSVTLLGAMSGFVTGGATAGNALFMPSAAATGEAFDATTLFAALQHGAAGHMGMAALPVLVILLAALVDRTPQDDRTAMRIGLGLNLVYIPLLIASGTLLMWAGVR